MNHVSMENRKNKEDAVRKKKEFEVYTQVFPNDPTYSQLLIKIEQVRIPFIQMLILFELS